jgi:hypothetical protein
MAGKALLAVQYERQYAGAIDKDYSFTTTERIAYLSNARRYPGQIVYDSDEDKNYRLNFARNTWLELGGSSLPTQTGNSGKYLKTNGTTATWEVVTAGVSSVNSNTGAVVLTADSFSDTTTTNKWWTNARTISSTLTSYAKSATNVAITASHTILQAIQILERKFDDITTDSVTFKISPDFSVSDDVDIKGVIYDVTEDRMAEDGSVPTSGTYTYSYRDSTSPTWTSSQTLAQLKTRLTGHSTTTITIVKATNTTTTVLNRVRLNLKRYA